MAPLRPVLLTLPLALAGLVGCSGTPFGDQLSRSFSQPLAGTRPSPPAAAGPGQGEAAARPAGPPSAADGAMPTTPRAVPPATPGPAAARRAIPAPLPLTPAPYRVTIKLPAADPSSPAEAVTDALRAAGVAFEVETIERVPAGADTAAAPVRSPAPAPR